MTALDPAMRRLRLAAVLIFAVTAAGSVGAAPPTDDGGPHRFKGLSLVSALDKLQREGLKIIFSSELVRPEMIVRSEPRGRWPQEILDELLAPHGLRSTAGPSAARLIVKAPPEKERPEKAAPTAPRTPRDPVPPRGYVEHVLVWAADPASRAEVPVDRDSLDRRELQSSPELDADPLRPVARLVGVAAIDGAGGLHVRGGSSRETKIIFDGLELYEPYHLKDRGGPISILDAQNVAAVDLLSGGFPAEYGGHMSAVVQMHTVVATDRLDGVVGASSGDVRMAGQGVLGDRVRWLFSARSGDPSRLLDALGADPAYRPPFSDFFAKSEYRPDDRTALSLHVLGADDEVEAGDNDAVLSTLYGSGTLKSRHTQRYAWLTLRRAFSPRLFSQTVLSAGLLTSDRTGSSPRVAELRDARSVRILGVKQDWWRQAGRHLFKWGLDVKQLAAAYAYTSVRTADEPLAITSRPAGSDVGAYAADRLRLSRDLNVEIGLRWDRQSYTPGRHGAVSPRMNLSYRIGDRTALKASWGYFHQPQRIHELQVEDGIDRFFGAARAEHRLVSCEHELGAGLTLRLNGYQKRMSRLSPRFENLLDPFGFFPEADGDRVMIAPEAARADGLELVLRRRMPRSAGWWVGYGLARADDRIDGRWEPRAWDQRHALTAAFEWRPRPRWSLALAGTHHSGRPATPVSAGGAIGARNSLRLPADHRLDARLSRSVAIRGSDLIASVTLTDGFDREQVWGVADIGRLVTFGLAWRF